MSTVEEKISVIIESIRKDLASENYYSALVVAFTLPDVTSNLQFPNKHTNKRYIKWFEDYLQEKYTKKYYFLPEGANFFSGEDFYALRCSMLHQGETEILNQQARKHLSNFVFLKPTEMKKGSVHSNLCLDKIQLQVDKFCEEIIEGAEKWLEQYKYNTDINDRAKNLINIREFNNKNI